MTTNILIFAKYPEAGKAKTRLAKGIGFDKASDIAEKLLTTTLVEVANLAQHQNQIQTQNFATNQQDIQATVFVSPEPDHPQWKAYKQKLYVKFPSTKTLHWVAQSDGDLGDRLINATQTVRNQQAKTSNSQSEYAKLYIGTDCPALTADKLQTAIGKLAQTDSVLIPAHDGGYVLLGTNSMNQTMYTQLENSLFTNMPWSTETVAELTLARIKAHGLSVTVLPSETDIDHAEDLANYDMDALFSVY